MTRVVEAHPKVLVMRNPKTESKEKFMARAEELADRLYEEPVADAVESTEEEMTVPMGNLKTEVDYLRWFHTHIAQQRGPEGIAAIQKEYADPLPLGYAYAIE